jgi:putative membrane protein
VKAFHVIFMVTWFAGLFYLPRLFVYHADVSDAAGEQRFQVMEKKLFAIMTIGAALTVIFGLWMLFDYAWVAYAKDGWLHAKLFLVVLLIGYHIYCLTIIRNFRSGKNTRSHVFYRWFNEFPVLLLFGIVILVIVRPF